MDISQITDYLFVGAQPEARHAPNLQALGINLIISMRVERRPPAAFVQPPLRTVWLRTFDVFFLPIPVRTLMKGVEAALPVIAAGGRVLVHCHRGKHRSVAQAAAILMAHEGCSAEAAMRLLREHRAIARPQTWYIQRQILAFEKFWKSRVVE